MIKKITMKNIFSFDNVTIELNSLNLLIGISGSGKTNFIKVLYLLSYCDNFANKLWSLGGYDEICNNSPEPISIEVEFNNGNRYILDIDKNSIPYEYFFVNGKLLSGFFASENINVKQVKSMLFNIKINQNSYFEYNVRNFTRLFGSNEWTWAKGVFPDFHVLCERKFKPKSFDSFFYLLDVLIFNGGRKIIALESIENNFHPDTLYTLSEMIKNSCLSNQVVIITYSPLLLNHFDYEDVIAFNLRGNKTEISTFESEQFDDNLLVGQAWVSGLLGAKRW